MREGQEEGGVTELVWDGKYKDGKRAAPVRIALPFQTVETVNESGQVRAHQRELWAARLWCDNATDLTGTRWDYIKVPQKDFYDMQPADFADITFMR